MCAKDLHSVAFGDTELGSNSIPVWASHFPEPQAPHLKAGLPLSLVRVVMRWQEVADTQDPERARPFQGKLMTP